MEPSRSTLLYHSSPIVVNNNKTHIHNTVTIFDSHFMWSGILKIKLKSLLRSISLAPFCWQSFISSSVFDCRCIRNEPRTRIKCVRTRYDWRWLVREQMKLGNQAFLFSEISCGSNLLHDDWQLTSIWRAVSGLLLSSFIMFSSGLYVLTHALHILSYDKYEWLYALSITGTHVSTAPIAFALSSR